MQLNVEKPKQFKSWLKSNKMSSKKFAKISGIKQQALKKATKKKSLKFIDFIENNFMFPSSIVKIIKNFFLHYYFLFIFKFLN